MGIQLSSAYRLFIGFKKAYDSVRREVLYYILIEFGILTKLVRLMFQKETYSAVQVSKHLSDMFPVRDGLQQGDVLTPMLFNLIKVTPLGGGGGSGERGWLEIQWHTLGFWYMLTMLIYWLKEYILLKKTQALLVGSKEIGPEVNADKTKYLLMSRDQNARRSHSSFESFDEFKYLGTTLTNRKSIYEEIKSRLKSWNACYHSVQNILSSSLLPKNFNIKIY